MATQAGPLPQPPQPSFFASKRGRKVLENLTAYLFIAPAALIIFVFGLFPVAFAFFVSLHRWRRFPEEFRGLDAYVEATGNMAYVVFFWLAIAILIYAVLSAWRFWRNTYDQRQALIHVVPGVLSAFGVLAFLNWFFVLLPVVLDVPRRLLGQPTDQAIFVDEFLASFRFAEPLAAADTMWLVILLAVGAVWLTLRFLRHEDSTDWIVQTAIATLALVIGGLLLQLTLSEINIAIEDARADGEALPIWSQIILISAGASLLGFGAWLWNLWVKMKMKMNMELNCTRLRFFLNPLMASCLPDSMYEIEHTLLHFVHFGY